jgi:medium-chain acyl-[acyl-carrier-protein] hydrolase
MTLPMPALEDAEPIRLFCVPHAGAGAGAYRTWLALRSDVDVRPLQPPGREARFREPSCRQLEPLVEDLAVAVARERGGRFALFGHSVGAIVAFELARRLRREPSVGEPAHLFVAAAVAPRRVASVTGGPPLGDDELVSWLARANGTPRAAFDEPELLQIVLPPLRADVEVYAGYRYVAEAPLTCPISVFRGRDDDLDVEGWEAETTAGCSVSVFPGDHFFVKSAGPQVLDAIARELARAAPTL